MTSQINITNIDQNFPVAGVDNSSQGFRDNFANIKIAFTTATNEISDLQLNTAKLNDINDFGFTGSLKRVTIQRSGYTAINTAATDGTIDFSLGHYHKSAITTSTTFVVSNWPSSGVYASVRLEVKPATTASMTVNFSGGAGTLIKESSIGTPAYTSTTTNSTIWDLWTTDGGTRVFLKFVGGPFA